MDTAGIIDTEGGSPDLLHGGLDSYEGEKYWHLSEAIRPYRHDSYRFIRNSFVYENIADLFKN